MIFGTLNRYFFLRYAITTGWFFVGVTAIVFLADFSENAGRLSGLPGYTVAIGLLMTAVRLPLILQQTMPFLVLFVGMTTLIALNRRYELVIARAAGISVWQFMAPFIFGAFIVGLLTMLVLNPIAAAGQRQADALEADLRGDPSYHNRLSVPWLRQIARDDDVIIGAKTVVDNGMTLMNAVFIHFNPQGDVVLRQDANSAKLEDGYWLLTGVVERAPGRSLRTRLRCASVRI